jgi:hypothetical protein
VPRPLGFTSRITALASLQVVNMAVMLVWLPGRRRVSPSLRRLAPERRTGICFSTPSTDNGAAKQETVHLQRSINNSNDLANGRLSIYSALYAYTCIISRLTVLRRGRQRVPI